MSEANNQLSFNPVNKPQSATHPLPESIILPDGELWLYRQFFNEEESNKLFQELLSQTDWKQDKIKCYGKEINLPRLTAWYGDPGKNYTYSNISMNPEPWTPILLYIKKRIEDVSLVEFNSVLLNFYRSGQDSISWHKDDEPELGQNPVIGSVSLGATRRFQLKHKFRKDLTRVDIDLTHGSFLLMKDKTQHFWLHQIPKTAKTIEQRINLTFRVIG